jgi:hypothetical protein
VNRRSPQLTAAATRIVDHAFSRKGAPGTPRDAAFLVIAEMRPHLANLMGSAGFRALLLRALAMTMAQHPWLRAVRVNADGSIEGLDQPGATVSPGEFRNANIALLTRSLSLLAVFVGEAMTIRLMRDVWPDTPLADLKPGSGDNR